jgi:hypothetical protein
MTNFLHTQTEYTRHPAERWLNSASSTDPYLLSPVHRRLELLPPHLLSGILGSKDWWHGDEFPDKAGDVGCIAWIYHFNNHRWCGHHGKRFETLGARRISNHKPASHSPLDWALGFIPIVCVLVAVATSFRKAGAGISVLNAITGIVEVSLVIGIGVVASAHIRSMTRSDTELSWKSGQAAFPSSVHFRTIVVRLN